VRDRSVRGHLASWRHFFFTFFGVSVGFFLGFFWGFLLGKHEIFLYVGGSHYFVSLVLVRLTTYAPT
jgi:hypothetical protein